MSLNDGREAQAARLGPPRAQRTRGSAPGGHLRHVSQLVLVVITIDIFVIFDSFPTSHVVSLSCAVFGRSDLNLDGIQSRRSFLIQKRRPKC